jgi:hypothetical protein
MKHVKLISQAPNNAQVSTLQIKLDSVTVIFDRLLLAGRQQPWKATGPSGGGTDTTDTTTGGGTDIEL